MKRENIMNKKIKLLNEIKLIAFAAIIGSVAGLVFWGFLWLINFLRN